MFDEESEVRRAKRVEKLQRSMCSCMNNTKWRKLFCLIEREEIRLRPWGANVKVLGEDNLYPITLALANERWTVDGVGAPVELSEIEYMLFELQSESELERFEKLLGELGQLEYDLLPENCTVRIYGYK